MTKKRKIGLTIRYSGGLYSCALLNWKLQQSRKRRKSRASCDSGFGQTYSTNKRKPHHHYPAGNHGGHYCRASNHDHHDPLVYGAKTGQNTNAQLSYAKQQLPITDFRRAYRISTVSVYTKLK